VTLPWRQGPIEGQINRHSTFGRISRSHRHDERPSDAPTRGDRRSGDPVPGGGSGEEVLDVWVPP
jgi:hypothetical protein